jgi:hypothetical protein
LDGVQSVVHLGNERPEILEPIAGSSDDQSARGETLDILLELDASVHREEHLEFPCC